MEQHRNDWDELESLLTKKSFQELTVDERILALHHFESEDDYEQFRAMSTSLQQRIIVDAINPKVDTLKSLKSSLRSRQRPVVSWWNFSMPAYATVVLIFIFTGIGWWIGQVGSAPQIVEREIIKSDTVFVALKPDTLYVEKVSPHRSPVTQVSMKNIEPELIYKPDEQGDGVTMKDAEELETLLISGNGVNMF